MSVSVKSTGHFKSTLDFLDELSKNPYRDIFEKYGKLGVQALTAATPVDTGKTASSWEYKIIETKDATKLQWHNTNVDDGVVVAVLIQYGHATRNGGYVQGRDFINPAIKPILDGLADQIWKEVTG